MLHRQIPRIADVNTNLERALRVALERRGVKVTKALLSDLIRAFGKHYVPTPVRRIKRTGELITMQVRSKSDVSRWYNVRLNGTISLDNHCDCEAGQYHQMCSHLRHAWQVAQFLIEAEVI